MDDKSTADYSQMTDDEFRETLTKIVGKMSTEEILAIGDIYSVLAEELNNEVLDHWASLNEDKAYPERDDES